MVTIPKLTQEQIDEIVKAEFHRAWGVAHGDSEYNKEAWRYVQKYIDPAYRNQRKQS